MQPVPMTASVQDPVEHWGKRSGSASRRALGFVAPVVEHPITNGICTMVASHTVKPVQDPGLAMPEAFAVGGHGWF
jgi:hypothetical protein